MINLTISIFGNKIFFEIISEMKIFSKFNIKYYEDFELCIKEAEINNFLVIFFISDKNKNLLTKNKTKNFPSIFVAEPKILKNLSFYDFNEKLSIPFFIKDFEKKIISLIAKNEFKKNSLIKLEDYIIDKNERKIKKNNLELQLSEKETDFLILFSKNEEPITKNFVLKNVWNYSIESETHTVETHIHRLRKKILEKFGDKDFIKNNNKGYYI
tara:strand:+ start:22 stop:660 length:639 start_codon:yes stop_codon:yes gene_type:complete